MERAKVCREEWLAVFEQFRRVEATKSEVEIEFSKLCSAIRAEVDALSARLTHKLVGLDSAAMLTAIQREMTVFCRHLVG